MNEALSSYARLIGPDTYIRLGIMLIKVNQINWLALRQLETYLAEIFSLKNKLYL